MSNKTINQALKDLYLGLGGDASALTDNSTVSDYIEDLESAIKGAAGGVEIDDTTASESTVYSSSKTEDLIEGVLPTVEASDIGDVLTVVSDGEGGAVWSKGAVSEVIVINCVYNNNQDRVELPNGVTWADIGALVKAGKVVEIEAQGDAYAYTFTEGGYSITNNTANMMFTSVTFSNATTVTIRGFRIVETDTSNYVTVNKKDIT